MSEGAAAPSPAPATPQSTSQPAPTETPKPQAAPQEGTPEEPSIRIKPIPPRRERIKFKPEELPKVSPDGEAIPEGYIPRLPGVVTDDTGAEEIPSLEKPRDEKGRFVKGTTETRPDLPEGAPAEGGQEVKPELPEGQKPPEPGKIKFLGKEYKSVADVEQLHRTLQGEHRKLVEDRRKMVEEVDYGYRSGNAWKAEFDRVSQENQQLRAMIEGKGGSVPAQPAGQPTGQPAGSGVSFDMEAAISDIDMNAFEMIAAHPRGGLPNAGKYLVAETLRVVNEKLVPTLLAQINQRLAPVETLEQARAAETNQLQQFELVAGMKTFDGDAAFPELGDEVAVDEIGELWGRAKKRNLETAQDIIDAIALYRLMKGLRRPPAQTLPAGEVSVVPQPAPAAAASLEAESTGLTPGGGQRAQGSPEQRRLLAALDKVELVDPVLGFRRNQ